jgi:hypothetical protein
LTSGKQIWYCLLESRWETKIWDIC